MENENEEFKFYRICSEILNCEIDIKERKTLTKVDRHTGELYQTKNPSARWHNREPGNGRFPGYGIIRLFSMEHIQVNLHHPVGMNRIFTNQEEVFDLLRDLKSKSTC